jgi:pimeloyl-ACP methyl ester carboxylesterase
MAAAAHAAASATFSHADALAHLFLANAAYCDPAETERWVCAPCVRASAALGVRRFDLVRQFSGNYSNMQGFVASAPGLVAVAFRGTAEYFDYWIDLQEYRTAPYPSCSACLVHSGFLSAWNDVQAEVLSGVRDALRAQPGARLVVVGHSLGGAVAIIAALHIATADGSKPPSAVFTFGEPRVGNGVFSFFYEGASRMWPSWRVTHAHDLVPHLPPRNVFVPYVLDYAHHTREVWYADADNASAHATCSADDGEDYACADSVWVYQLSIADHLQYLGETVGLGSCAPPQVAAALRQRAPTSWPERLLPERLRSSAGARVANGDTMTGRVRVALEFARAPFRLLRILLGQLITGRRN